MTITPTQVRFCHQTWQLRSQVQYVAHHSGGCDIVTDLTPFHPLSHIWPDHPADRGHITVHGQTFSVTDCLVGAYEYQTQQLLVGEAIPVKRDAPGWAFVVVHRVALEDYPVNVGDVVELSVEQQYQQALSRGHSAGHLAYLALNKVLDQAFWRKEADRKDTLGHRDFNSYAQQSSRVGPDSSFDCYRLGKTLRKRGLNTGELIAQLSEIENNVNQQLKLWIANDPAVEMRCEGGALTDSRYWQCDLGEGQLAVIPCGGTHIQRLSQLQTCQVTLTAVDEQNIEMHTRVLPTHR